MWREDQLVDHHKLTEVDMPVTVRVQRPEWKGGKQHQKLTEVRISARLQQVFFDCVPNSVQDLKIWSRKCLDATPGGKKSLNWLQAKLLKDV